MFNQFPQFSHFPNLQPNFPIAAQHRNDPPEGTTEYSKLIQSVGNCFTFNSERYHVDQIISHRHDESTNSTIIVSQCRKEFLFSCVFKVIRQRVVTNGQDDSSDVISKYNSGIFNAKPNRDVHGMSNNQTPKYIVREFEYRSEDGLELWKEYVIVSKYFGESLFRMMRSRRAGIAEDVSVAFMLECICKCLENLEQFHLNGIVHCNVEPSNIFKDKCIELGGLGCVQLSTKDPEVLVDCKELLKWMPKAFTAPEVQTKQLIGLKSDIWSLGMVLLRFLFPNLVNLVISDSNIDEIFKGLSNVERDDACWNEIKNLIKSMLTIDVKKRPTSGQLLNSITNGTNFRLC